MFDSSEDRSLETVGQQQAFDDPSNLGEPALGGVGSFLDLLLETFPLLGMEIAEAQVLHLDLDAADSESIGDGREDIQGLPRDGHLSIGTEIFEGPHIVQSIGELDQNDPDVIHGSEEEPAEVLGLGGFAGRERAFEVGELRERHDQAGDIRSKLELEFLGRRVGVLEKIVQQPGGDGDLVEFHLGENPGHGQRMDEIGLSRSSHLTLVAVRGKDIGVAKQILIQIGPVELDSVEDVLDADLRRLIHPSIVRSRVKYSVFVAAPAPAPDPDEVL